MVTPVDRPDDEISELREEVERLTAERNEARDMRDRYRAALESCEAVLSQTQDELANYKRKCRALHDDNRGRVLSDIIAERRAQDAKWGEQNHDPSLWLAILTEEVGELAQATLAHTFGKVEHGSHSADLRTEAIQVAAVATAFVEFLDRHRNAAREALQRHVDERLLSAVELDEMTTNTLAGRTKTDEGEL